MVTSTGVSTLGSTVLAPNLVDTTHFPQVVQQNEVPEHLSSMTGEAHTQFHHLVHLCLCGFHHRNSWASQCHICLTEHIFSTSELASHFYSNSPNNIYTAIRGLMFDLTQVSTTHMYVSRHYYPFKDDLTKVIDNISIDSGILVAQKTCLRNHPRNLG